VLVAILLGRPCLHRHAPSAHVARVRLLLWASVAGLAACGSPTGDDLSPGACPQTYEFGNTGCAEVQALVVSTAGQPLEGRQVGLISKNRDLGILGEIGSTNARGEFRGRMTRMFGRPPVDGSPDTVTVVVIASDPWSAPPRIVDSAMVLVTMAPVGAVPSPVQARVVLPIP
jgi:hypothetical protein